MATFLPSLIHMKCVVTIVEFHVEAKPSIYVLIISIKQFLTHHAGILQSQPGVGYLFPPSHLLRLRQCDPTLHHYFFMTTTTTTTTQLNKLPLATIIYNEN